MSLNLLHKESGEKDIFTAYDLEMGQFEEGDTVTLELAGAYHRYHAHLVRTMSLGYADKRLKNLTEVTKEGLHKAIDAIKPGVVCGDIADVWNKNIQKHGYRQESRIGYSVGVNYPPYFGAQMSENASTMSIAGIKV